MVKINQLKTQEQIIEYNRYHTNKILKEFQLQNQYVQSECYKKLTELADKCASRLRKIKAGEI